MRPKVLVVSVSMFLALVAAHGQDPTSKAKTEAAEKRLEAAQEAWKSLTLLDQYATERGAEARYQWSRRLMEASQAVDASRSAEAARAHLKRMEALLESSVALADASQISPLDPRLVRYYVAEAKVFVEDLR